MQYAYMTQATPLKTFNCVITLYKQLILLIHVI